MKAQWKIIVSISIVLISVLMHAPHLNKDLMSIHVWRQTQTQSTINSFYEEDMNILNPRRNDRGDSKGIFRMEFPLMQWLVALSYKVFGPHIIVTRLFMLITGFLSILGLFKLLQALFQNDLLAMMGAWAFNFSPCFYYYTINPLPDNFALCASIWGLAVFFDTINKGASNYHLLWSGLLLGIGALCKLPFIIFFIVPGVYFLRCLIKEGANLTWLAKAFLSLFFVLLPLLWYVSVIPTWHGNPIVQGMFGSQESIVQLLDYYQHNLISTLPELLLNYGSVVFFLGGFYFFFKRKAYRHANFLLILVLSISCLAYYFFEANAIADIHDYYLFPFYPLLFMLVAYGAFYIYSSEKKIYKYITLFLLAILPITCYLRMQTRWNPNSPGFNKDLLVFKEQLRQAVPDNALVVAGNDISHFIFFYYIDKKGWGIHGDMLSAGMLQDVINRGAQYLYTDSNKISSDQKLAKYFGETILERGSIKVIKLRKVDKQ